MKKPHAKYFGWCRHPDMTPSAKLMLFALVSFGTPKSNAESLTVWPSISTLCDVTAMSRSRVFEALKVLKMVGAMSREGSKFVLSTVPENGTLAVPKTRTPQSRKPGRNSPENRDAEQVNSSPVNRDSPVPKTGTMSPVNRDNEDQLRPLEERICNASVDSSEQEFRLENPCAHSPEFDLAAIWTEYARRRKSVYNQLGKRATVLTYTPTAQKMLKALRNEGYTREQFLHVIDVVACEALRKRNLAWLNAITPWRPKNFARAAGIPTEAFSQAANSRVAAPEQNASDELRADLDNEPADMFL